jgi:hypothetical protein
MGMPNLFSLLPVAILAWVFASTSGLTRMAMGAVAPREAATSLSARISGSLSRLNCRTPPISAARISPRVLPTPEKTILSPDTPAASARRYSPSDTTSMPAPASPRSRRTATLDSALTAKQTRCGIPVRASSKRLRCRSRVAEE